MKGNVLYYLNMEMIQSMSFGYIARINGKIIPSDYFPDTPQGEPTLSINDFLIIFRDDYIRLCYKNRIMFAQKGIKDNKKKDVFTMNGYDFIFYDAHKLFKERFKNTPLDNHPCLKDIFYLTFSIGNTLYEIYYGFGMGNKARLSFLAMGLKEESEKCMIWTEFDEKKCLEAEK